MHHHLLSYGTHTYRQRNCSGRSPVECSRRDACFSGRSQYQQESPGAGTPTTSVVWQALVSTPHSAEPQRYSRIARSPSCASAFLALEPWWRLGSNTDGREGRTPPERALGRIASLATSTLTTAEASSSGPAPPGPGMGAGPRYGAQLAGNAVVDPTQEDRFPPDPPPRQASGRAPGSYPGGTGFEARARTVPP